MLPVISTIVDGERPPIAVKHSENVKLDDEHTTAAVFHKAEPGRDIFAAEADKDGKSSLYMQRKQEENKEEKAISSVLVDRDDYNGIAFQESKPIVISTKSSTAAALTTTSANGDKMVVEKAKVQAGPLGEAEVEAQRAAQELFPDQ